MSNDDLAAQTAKLVKLLGWAGFLLAASLVILVIDLQLKRSIARTAIVAAGRHDSITRMADAIMADLRGGARGRGPVAKDHDAGSHGGADGLPGMDGMPPMATGTDQADDPDAGVPAAAPASPRVRAPRNGRRASRADT